MKGSQMSVNKVYVLDTNIILHNTNFIKELCDGGNNIIVIPETVLIELEDFLVNTKSSAALILNGKGKLITSLHLDYGDSIAAMSAAI